MDAEYILYDETKPLTANAYKKTGYTFAGWNTKADGSGQSYKDKAYVTNLATSGVTTLYAQWKPLTDTRYTVYYAYEGIPGQQNTGWFETQRRGTAGTMVKPDLSLFAKTGFTSGCMEQAEQMGNVHLVTYQDILNALQPEKNNAKKEGTLWRP